MSMTSTDKAIFTGDALIIVNCGVYYIWTDDTESGMFWQATGDGGYIALSWWISPRVCRWCTVGIPLKETGDYHENMDSMCCILWFLEKLLPNILLGPPLWWIMPCANELGWIKYWLQQTERMNWL
jgi:hypothetical protein